MSDVHLRSAVPGVLAGASVGALAALDGGYFAVEWGWSALGFLVAIATALVLLERVEIGRLDVAFVGGLAALAALTVLSAAWSDSPPRSLDESLRILVYVAGAAAFLLTANAQSTRWLVGGVWAAATAVTVHALLSEWLGDPEDDRLSGALGYWNALALLAGMGLVLALGLLMDLRQTAVRLASLASLPVFLSAVVLTESRGALIAIAAAVAVLAGLRVRRRAVPRTVVAGAAGVALLGGVGLVLALGGAGRVTDAFQGTSPAGGGLDDRILSVSGSGRDEYWRVAWRQYAENRALGSGAGTFELYWNRERNTIYNARDAHSLYLETLAELGPVGLSLLLVTLAFPLLAAWRTRRMPWIPAATAAYVAYLVHAALDWDWELPALTLAALACASVPLVAARRATAHALTPRRRLAALVPVVAFAIPVFVMHVANGALRESERAYERGDVATAASEARRAARWAPWASAPRRALAEAELAAGDETATRQALREALERDPLDWRLWYLRAVVSRGAARERALGEAARLSPLSADVIALQSR